MRKSCTTHTLTYLREYTVRFNQDFMTLFIFGKSGGNAEKAIFHLPDLWLLILLLVYHFQRVEAREF
ncbi:MAG: hypothetical protein CM15mP9_0060 [Methanobacteriota archaeon]|nr:MAG: hypothetical protein CM15mP9_0060 [Euryarchaeota archaeon]